ncbi:MAG: recombinase family protein [Candidatus Moranbacteria bacterium]|nr:recombinase family protein [Candidatus Moranbacteria bacterium]
MEKTKTSKKKFVIYARKSSEDNNKQVHSIDAQIFVMKEIAKHENIIIVEIFQESKSAKDPGRPVFNKMITKFKRGKYDGILCWKIDRLARNPVDAGAIQWLLQKYLIKQIITSDRRYNPEDNVLIASVEFGMSNQYVLDLSKNVKRGFAEKCRRGEYPGCVPVGYLRDWKTKSILIDPEKWHFIKKAFRLYSTGLYSIDKLVNILNKDGFRSKTGKLLKPSVIGNMLKNPLYYGWFLWNGQLHKGNHPPIISKDLFDKANEIMFPRKHQKREDIRNFTFRGFMTCGECGLKITAEVQRDHTYYRCTKTYGTDKCSQKYIREEELIKEIDKQIKKLNIEDDILKLTIKATQEERREQLQRHEDTEKKNQMLLDKNRQSQNALVEKFIQNSIPENIYNRMLAEYRNEEARLEENIQSAKENYRDVFEQIEKIAQFTLLAKEIFNDGDDDVKKEVVALLSSNIVIKDKKIKEFIVNFPFNLLLEDMKSLKARNKKIGSLEHLYFAFHKQKTAPCETASFRHRS